MLVNDGQTTVIGGIFVSQEQTNNDKTPGLGSVPLIKWLFKREDITQPEHRTADLHHASHQQRVRRT